MNTEQRIASFLAELDMDAPDREFIARDLTDNMQFGFDDGQTDVTVVVRTRAEERCFIVTPESVSDVWHVDGESDRVDEIGAGWMWDVLIDGKQSDYLCGFEGGFAAYVWGRVA